MDSRSSWCLISPNYNLNSFILLMHKSDNKEFNSNQLCISLSELFTNKMDNAIFIALS